MTFLFLLSIFSLGFLFLWKGAELFVTNASKIAAALKVPEIVIGLTIVAFGTSLPELVVNILASIDQQPDLIIGNILGSNIANIGLILGLLGSFSTLHFPKRTTQFELPISIIALSILAGTVLFISPTYISRMEGAGLLIIFSVIYAISIKINHEEPDSPLTSATHPSSLLKPSLLLIIGLIGIITGGICVIDSGTNLARLMGLSEALIALFGIALGTSLPELITGIVALRKGKADLIIGNIIGSNIFNTLLIIGISSIIYPIRFNPMLLTDLSVCILFSLAVGLSIQNKSYALYRWGGFIVLVGYILYSSFIFIRG